MAQLMNRIRELREERQWTLFDLSQRSGVQVGTLSKIETQHADLRSSTALDIARAFELQVEDLFLPGASTEPVADSLSAGRPGDGAAPSRANRASTPPAGQPSVAGFVEPRLPGDRTASELAVAKES